MADRIAWLSELAVGDVLPERVVVVPNEAVAHSWRRDALASGRASLLGGTRFVTPLGAATATLALAGVNVTTGEESVRPARITALIANPELELPGLDMRVLRERPGWDRALARSIGDLESAGFDREELATRGDCAGLVELWRLLDERAGSSWTNARVFREATHLMRADHRAWPYSGSVLAEVTGHETAVRAAWLRAIPEVTLRYVRVRPLRAAHGERARTIFPDLMPRDPPAIEAATERDLLAAYLFASPDALGSPTRPRSRGPDDTIHFEEHAGVEAELEAAVAWALDELAAGVPAEQIAIVVPRIDPFATLLHHRFGALETPDPTHVVGGLPATATSSGARILTVLDALARHLHRDAMVEVLPLLATTGDTHVSRRDAIALIYELGTIGGAPSDPSGALAWSERRRARVSALTAELPEADDDDDRGRERRRKERMLQHLEAIGPALDALTLAARQLANNASLQHLWAELQIVLREHVRVGGDGQRIISALDARLAPAIAAGLLSGAAALETIELTLESLRLPVGRFGEPRITIVALTDSVGLTFDRVRVLGLSEGVVPPSTREDPILPDALRLELGREIRTSSDRTLATLHALHRLVLGTRQRIVLSVARVDVERGYREPSGIMLEAAAALARPPLDASRVIPDARLMRGAYYEPGRVKASTRTVAGVPAWLMRAARTRAIPHEWATDPLRPLTMPQASTGPSIMDGWLPSDTPVELPGASAEYPISASMLGALLGCPHRFLYERVLGWRAPEGLVDEGAIDALSYGSLFHGIAEQFYETHGRAFCDREGELASWQQIAGALADEHFVRFLERYPLVGADVRSAHRDRLRRDLFALLTADWSQPKTFFAVEQPFSCTLDVDGAPLHVHGFIDRIDRTGERTLVRDLKTGRAKPRTDDELWPSYDVQLGLYGLVTAQHATEWNVPAAIDAAYVYPSDSSGDARSFVGDFETLATATREWLSTAASLLRRRLFPRTPDEDDCTYCAFQPVCGPEAQTRARTLVESADELVAFRRLKLGAADDDE